MALRSHRGKLEKSGRDSWNGSAQERPAAWYSDPFGTSDLRWWDGKQWTDHVHAVLGSGSAEAKSARTNGLTDAGDPHRSVGQLTQQGGRDRPDDDEVWGFGFVFINGIHAYGGLHPKDVVPQEPTISRLLYVRRISAPAPTPRADRCYHGRCISSSAKATI